MRIAPAVAAPASTDRSCTASGTAGVIPRLQPETAHSFTVRASDFGGNASPLSDPVSATTEAAPEDDEAPTSPAPLFGQNWGCEVELDWAESQDNTAQPFAIQYEILVNGVLDHTLMLRHTETIVYGAFNGPTSSPSSRWTPPATGRRRP